MLQRVGVYWHMLPTAAQARMVVWDNIDDDGRRIIDQVFPLALRKRTNSNEMKIELKNGSIWQLCGSDNYNRLVGPNPVGVVFSEFSLADPKGWSYIKPILRKNGGWAIFIFTPRGKNHAHDLYQSFKQIPDYFTSLLTISDTGILTEDDMEAERREGTPEAEIQQEYFCSFTAPNEGSYYGKLIQDAEQEKRITSVPWESSLPVHTAWDLGINDETSIWFFQLYGKEVRLIDHYKNNGEALNHYVNVMHRKPYTYGQHILPHDINVRELGSGTTRLRQLEQLGLKSNIVLTASPVNEGINSVRALLPRCWFDQGKCESGLKSMRHYQKEWDDKRKVFKKTPLHDWSSHDADAFRTLAQGIHRCSNDFNAPVTIDYGKPDGGFW